jgi:hypothetical protein
MVRDLQATVGVVRRNHSIASRIETFFEAKMITPAAQIFWDGC